MATTVPVDRIPSVEPPSSGRPDVSRRLFLRGAALSGISLGIAACSPQLVHFQTASPGASAAASLTPVPATGSPAPSGSASGSPAASPSASAGGPPAGWSEHDLMARDVVRRYIGNLAPALKGIYGDAAFAKLADTLGAAVAAERAPAGVGA